MNEFEKEYYESAEFWKGEMLHDNNNKMRFEKTASLIPQDVNNLVDVGCGNGVFVNYLLEKSANLDVYAVDRSNAALEFVKTKKENAEITQLPFADRFFDCVTCLEVLEHLTINDFQIALSELTRVSKKYIIVSVPFEENIEESYTKCPSCKSIFNYELHLRRFDQISFTQLFDGLGFSNMSFLKLGESTQFKGHFAYRKMFYPEQLLKWRSPVCPICGYREQRKSTTTASPSELSNGKKRKLISYLSLVPKFIWPKEKKYYWIVGLFKRN